LNSPLLGNGWVSTFPRKGIGEIKKELLEVVISLRFDPSYKGDFVREVNDYNDIPCGTLRVVGGDEKESLESETVKYGHESHGTRT
jgi:hypothetical protein